MDQSNSTTGKQGGFNMTVTLDKKYTLVIATKEYITRRGEPPKEIKPLSGGKYFQLCADESEEELLVLQEEFANCPIHGTLIEHFTDCPDCMDEEFYGDAEGGE